MQCTGCKTMLDEDNSLKCNACTSYYCLECLNFTTVKKTSDLRQDQLTALKCPACANISQRQRAKASSPALLSPYKPKPSVSGALTLDSISNLLDQKLAPTSSAMIASRNMLLKEVKTLISAELSKVAKELRDEFTITTDLIMNEVNDLKDTISKKDDTIKTLQTEQTQLINEITSLRNRSSKLEKQSRDRNIEIQAVPEDRNESVVSLFKAVCEAVNNPIADSDIHACHRVAKMDSGSKRPRNIVVSLTSPRLRDNLLSAVHRFNKEHKSNKLSTHHIGLPGENRQIYVSEHLSPESKQLYAATRRFAKEKNYAFFWIRNGQIYLRKSDNTDAIRIKNTDVLKSLK